tara:strand:- start:971 stop:1342 length:372 start_codon:yes stop_codon:yes gene_type:complete
MKTLEYNYMDLSLVDLRYRGNNEKGYYILSFQTQRGEKIFPININKSIFETVLYKYFTPLFQYTREDLFKLRWCAYLSEGKYYQYDSQSREYGEVQGSDPDRIYVSRLDIIGDLHTLTYSDND